MATAAAAAAFTRFELMLLITETAVIGRYHICSRTLDTGEDRGWTATPIHERHFSRTPALCLIVCLSIGYVYST